MSHILFDLLGQLSTQFVASWRWLFHQTNQNQLNADAVGFGADVVVAATGCGVAVTDWTGVAYCCTED